MVFNHLVKHNGKYYPAGTEVPVGTIAEPIEVTSPYEEETDATSEDKTYTKTDISRMTTAELQKLAENEGIENALETSGAELKKMLVEHFGL